MLRWTGAGAVTEPVAVQIRVAPSFAGRVRVGAPVPARAMRPEEVRENIRWFAQDRVGPRTAPCTGLVLSGVSDPGGLVSVVTDSRALGIERVGWHLGGGAADPELLAVVDAVVRFAREPLAPLAGLPAGVRVTVVVPLEPEVLDGLDALTRALAADPPDQVVFQWPFPGGVAVPGPAAAAAAAVRGPVARLVDAGIAVGVKGIPPCVLAPGAVTGAWSERVWRSANRFYVDADHQRAEALMFFPDLVRFTKVEACRFCRVRDRCDGVVDAWYAQGLVGALRPVG